MYLTAVFISTIFVRILISRSTIIAKFSAIVTNLIYTTL